MVNFSRSTYILIFIFSLTGIWGCGGSPSVPGPGKPGGSVITGPSGESPGQKPGQSGTFKSYKINGTTYHPLAHARGFVQKGLASWYGKKFHGRKTANGETYNMYAMTAAHKTLPINTWVQVTNMNNGKKIVVRINDRGPFVRGRIIDLSHTGAKKLGVLGPGTAPVRIVALGKNDGGKSKTYIPVDYWKGDFTVQVGAFSIPANASRYRAKLSARYNNAHITTYNDYRGIFYRVRVGKFSQLEDAENFSRKLMSSGVDNAFPVAE
ncbi:septal ring lytic transglycosylase RlpA family protein [Desulfocicer niacini]